MFNIEETDSFFNCRLCQKVLEDPISLPCGESVCKAHTDAISQDRCLFCTENHIAPQNGFPSNKFVKNLLDKRSTKMNAHCNF